MAVLRRARKGRLWIALAAAGLVLLLLVLAQALLPGIAATRVRERVERYGQVRSVHVSAFPAVKLLWGSADSVSVVAGTLSAAPRQIGQLLWEARGLGKLSLSAQTAVLHPAQLPAGLALRGVHLRKQGSSVSATATLTQTQLEAALPAGFGVEPLASPPGVVEVRASGGLFGLQASVQASVRALEGDLVAEPRGLPFAGLARVTLFSDRHLKIDGLALHIGDGAPRTYALSVWGSLV